MESEVTMNLDTAIKLQASLDGELPPAEQTALRELLARDPEATALHAELRSTRQALADGELPRPVPASREFYWSQIEREIRRAEAAGERASAAHPVWAVWRRWMLPFAGTATLVLALALALLQAPGGRPGSVETVLDDGGALTYRDQAAGVTLVWFSFPATDHSAGENLEAFD